MPGKEVRLNCRVGAEDMKITVVGVVLIVAAVIAAVFVLRALNDSADSDGQPLQ
jgi:hypothetical protein